MTDGEKLRRFGADKIAFLILLIVGLLIAQFFISSRTSFKLSPAISLKGTGVEVSLPASNNWKQLTNDFILVNKEFQLAAEMQISSDSKIQVVWRYALVPIKVESAEKFSQIAAVMQGHIIKTGTDKFGQFTFDYAKIDSGDTILFVGTTVLPNERILTLEVAQRGAGIELAEKLFKALLASAKYYEDNSFAKGDHFLKEFKNEFLPELPTTDLKSQNVTDYFRLKDTANNSIGFTTDTLNYTAEANDNYTFAVSSLFFFSPQSKTIAEQSFFRSDIKLTVFDWLVREGDLQTNRQQSIHLQLGKDNIITIEKDGRIEQLLFTNIMIPESLFDLLTADFLKSNYDTIYIEALLTDGRIAPVILSRIKSSETAALPERSAAQADFFGSEFPSIHKLYYDGSGHLVSAEVQGSLAYKRERTTRTSLFADFPQWLNKIQQMEQYKNQNKKKNK
jgi:hypothetical protein